MMLSQGITSTCTRNFECMTQQLEIYFNINNYDEVFCFIIEECRGREKEKNGGGVEIEGGKEVGGDEVERGRKTKVWVLLLLGCYCRQISEKSFDKYFRDQ